MNPYRETRIVFHDPIPFICGQDGFPRRTDIPHAESPLSLADVTSLQDQEPEVILHATDGVRSIFFNKPQKVSRVATRCRGARR